MVDFMTDYVCILVENNVDEASRLLFTQFFYLGIKKNFLCVKMVILSVYFSGPGGHGPLAP